MPQDLRVARPFGLICADNRMHLWGVGFYPQVSDEIASLAYVQWHTQEACEQRGDWLAQVRHVTKTPAPGQRPCMVWLRPENSALYSTTIEAGWPPSFQDGVDIQFFLRLDCPQPDALQLGTDAAGKPYYRLLQRPAHVTRINQPLPPLDAIKVYPGDASPPVTARATPPAPPARQTPPSTWTPADTMRANARAAEAFAVMQRASARAQAEQAASHAAPPPSTAQPRVLAPLAAPCVPATPTPKKWDQSVYSYVDPRSAVPVAAAQPQAPPPPETARILPWHAAAEARTRARLERRAMQKWAA